MCGGLIEQREINTPRVISLYHRMTPNKNAWEASYNVKEAVLEVFHHDTIYVSSMPAFSMAHGRHFGNGENNFRSCVVI